MAIVTTQKTNAIRQSNNSANQLILTPLHPRQCDSEVRGS